MHILVPLSVVKNCNANLLLADYVPNEIMFHQGGPREWQQLAAWLNIAMVEHNVFCGAENNSGVKYAGPTFNLIYGGLSFS